MMKTHQVSDCDECAKPKMCLIFLDLDGDYILKFCQKCMLELGADFP